MGEGHQEGELGTRANNRRTKERYSKLLIEWDCQEGVTDGATRSRAQEGPLGAGHGGGNRSGPLRGRQKGAIEGATRGGTWSGAPRTGHRE